jgi:hypothetical protein
LGSLLLAHRSSAYCVKTSERLLGAKMRQALLNEIE